MNSVSWHTIVMAHICVMAHYGNGGIIGELWLVI
jgi:hypothetical protein